MNVNFSRKMTSYSTLLKKKAQPLTFVKKIKSFTKIKLEIISR